MQAVLGACTAVLGPKQPQKQLNWCFSVGLGWGTAQVRALMFKDRR